MKPTKPTKADGMGASRTAKFRQRRLLLASPLGAAAAVPALARPPTASGPLAPTPRQSRGPFYPLHLPTDAGSDLVIERDGRRAKGEIVHLSGTVLDTAGRPQPDALVEIWQCNANGRYHHPRDRNDAPVDPLFRGYGQVRTDAQGRYAFRTIRPVPYPGRTPHIHLQVDAPRGGSLVTQMYVRGEPGNARDGLLAGLAPDERERLMADFVRAGDGWAVRFDVVLAA
jgi:protocatechuate 3,4-dioxygenase, beta subunit